MDKEKTIQRINRIWKLYSECDEYFNQRTQDWESITTADKDVMEFFAGGVIAMLRHPDPDKMLDEMEDDVDDLQFDIFDLFKNDE